MAGFQCVGVHRLFTIDAVPVGVGNVIIFRYTAWNTRIVTDSQNSITLYIEVLLCGPVLQMETFIIYDKVQPDLSLLSSTASCSDCNPMIE
jgi:hypothetical protein